VANVYFSANSSKFETKLFREEKSKKIIRLVTVPAFYKSRSLVIINLNNLDCFEIALENALVL